VAVFPDPAHSDKEDRFKRSERSMMDAEFLIVFTLRTRCGDTYIRPISARYMHKKEVEHYEKEVARAQE
jgi:uncharacterized protein